jgi:hypothetical protein
VRRPGSNLVQSWVRSVGHLGGRMLDAELSAQAMPHAEDEDEDEDEDEHEECHRRASAASWASSDDICSVGRISLRQQIVVVGSRRYNDIANITCCLSGNQSY